MINDLIKLNFGNSFKENQILCNFNLCLHVLGLPLFYFVADKDDASGLVFAGTVIPFASMVITIFAAVLEQLLQEAINIKSEDDLTV